MDDNPYRSKRGRNEPREAFSKLKKVYGENVGVAEENQGKADFDYDELKGFRKLKQKNKFLHFLVAMVMISSFILFLFLLYVMVNDRI